MMIKKLLQLWQFIKNENNKPPQEVDVFEQINSHYFLDFNNSRNSHLVINTSFTNIVTLNNTLRNCTQWLTKGQRIHQPEVLKDSKDVKILNFFSHDGLYIDEEFFVMEFINLAQNYFSVFNEKSQSKQYIDSYNCSLLSKFNIEIKEIAQVFVSIQTH